LEEYSSLKIARRLDFVTCDVPTEPPVDALVDKYLHEAAATRRSFACLRNLMTCCRVAEGEAGAKIVTPPWGPRNPELLPTTHEPEGVVVFPTDGRRGQGRIIPIIRSYERSEQSERGGGQRAGRGRRRLASASYQSMMRAATRYSPMAGSSSTAFEGSRTRKLRRSFWSTSTPGLTG
jgi:hypothetical protein